MSNKTFVLALFVLTACQSADPVKAQQEAERYMHHFPGATGVECAGADTDRDGYITCTVFRGSADPLQIQCGAENWCVANCATGCKYEPIGKIRARAQ